MFALGFDKSTIPALASRYPDEGDKVIENEVQPRVWRSGFYSRADFLAVCRWKSARIVHQCATNSDDFIESATRTTDELSFIVQTGRQSIVSLIPRAELASFVGKVVMVRRKGTDKLQLKTVAARAVTEPVARVATKTPSDCSTSEITAFERLVLMGEEVEKVGLVDRIRRGEMLAFAYVSGVLAGVAALKHPNINYKTSVFKKSAASFPSTAFSLELGWMYILEAHRRKGLSGRLIRALLKQSDDSPVFATSRTKNTPMHRALQKAGFTRTGKDFLSGRGNHQLQLFVRGAARPLDALNAPHSARG